MALITITGIRPYEHQRAVIEALKDSRGTSKIVCVNSSRQKGKSYLVSNILLYFALNANNQKVFYLAPTLKQSKMLFKLIIDGVFKSRIIRQKNQTELTITFINNSVIYFKSAEQKDALRGYTADFLAVDEAAFIPDSIWHLVQPWTQVKKAPTLITSTPWVKNGFFYQYFCYGKERSHNTITIDWSAPEFKESIEEILPPERLREYEEILPKNVFLTDYLGKFLDDEGSVFTNIKSAIKKAVLAPGDRLYWGIDWSNQKENDYTVLTAFNQRGEMVYLKYFNKEGTLSQINKIFGEIEPYLKQTAVIVCETNSIGEPYTELLKKQSQVLANKIVGFNTSNSSKNALVVNFQSALEGGKATLLPDEKLEAEFGYFSASFNPATRTVSYAAPPGLHDDCVMSTLFAYHGLNSNAASGQYALRFGNKKHY